MKNTGPSLIEKILFQTIFLFFLFFFFLFSDREGLLKIDELNVENSTQLYLENINILLDTYALLKRIDKYKLRFKSKPWITLELQKLISVKKINC